MIKQVLLPTQRDYDRLMDAYVKKEWHWCNGESPKKNNEWHQYQERTCVTLENNFSYGSKSHYKEESIISLRQALVELNINLGTMGIIDQLRNLTATKEEKAMITHGLENPLGVPTEDGLQAMAELLYAENRKKLIAAVAELDKEDE